MSAPEKKPPELSPWRQKVWHIIFDHNTPASKAFDVLLLWAIAISVIVVMLESVDSYREQYGVWLRAAEWFFTILFTIEYFLRIIAARRPWRYMRSGFGIIDLLSFLPTYIEPFITGAHYLVVVRVLRLLRIFRILKMIQYVGEGNLILRALASSRRKIFVFVFFVGTIVVILGSVLYIVEHDQNEDFANIPTSVYWAVVTITTVGYGDITPVTFLGKVISIVIMLVGFAIIAVPTGIVVSELNEIRTPAPGLSGRSCPECSADGHDSRAHYCDLCGAKLETDENRVGTAGNDTG